MTTRVLLFGANGRLGKGLAMFFASHPEQFELIPITRKDFDLRFSPTLINTVIHHHNPNIVINAAAMNGMEACDGAPDQAIQINCLAPAAMALAAKQVGALFIHYSTDYTIARDFVQNERLHEDSAFMFGQAYSTSKILGELAVAQISQAYLIFRLSSLYGPDLGGSLDVVKQVQAGKGTKENPAKVLMQFAAPTSVRAVVEATRQVIEKFPLTLWRQGSGVYNMVNSAPMWKADFSRAVAMEFLGRADVVVIEGKLAIPRPVFCALDNGKLKNVFQVEMPGVIEDMQEEAEIFKAGKPQVH